MKSSIALLALSVLSASALAQTGTYTWQVSTDDGSNWNSEYFRSPGTTIKVRLLASWTGVPDAVGVGFAGGQLDALLINAASTDVVSNISRPVPFNFAPQTLVASLIPGGMKIDTSADISAPGAGVGWVNPGQVAHFANPSGFNSTNGVVIFMFDLFSNTDNLITFSSICNPVIGRAMSVYSNSTGSQVRINSSNVTIIPAIDIAPSPGPLALVCLGGLSAARRRRISAQPTSRSNP